MLNGEIMSELCDPNFRLQLKYLGCTIIDYILQTGDLNIKDIGGRTILMHAVCYKKENLVRLLLENGADPSFRNSFGETALKLAKSGGNQAIIDLLESKQDIKVNMKNKTLEEVIEEDKDKTPEEILAEARKNLVKILKR